MRVPLSQKNELQRDLGKFCLKSCCFGLCCRAGRTKRRTGGRHVGFYIGSVHSKLGDLVVEGEGERPRPAYAIYFLRSLQ